MFEGMGTDTKACPKDFQSVLCVRFFFVVNTLIAMVDVLFMGPEGKEGIWPK